MPRPLAGQELASLAVRTGGPLAAASGIDLTHPDLVANLWANPGEIAGDGIDNDSNGFGDDVHGWDFVDNDAVPEDGYGHGTHVAGIINAVGNNGVGVTGVTWQVSIMVPPAVVPPAAAAGACDCRSGVHSCRQHDLPHCFWPAAADCIRLRPRGRAASWRFLWVEPSTEGPSLPETHPSPPGASRGDGA